MKRDKIFYSALFIALIGVVLSALGMSYGILCFVVAYLLRPMLVEFGWAGKSSDEREDLVLSKAGDLGFILVMLAIAGFALMELAQRRQPEMLYEIIGLGLVGRALLGLLLRGEHRKAGGMIVAAIGFFLGIFVMLEAGFSLSSIFGLVIMSAFVGIAWLSQRAPRTIASLLGLIAFAIILGGRLLAFRFVNAAAWLFVILPLFTAAACLFLGSSRNPDGPSQRLRSWVFSSLGGLFAAIFIIIAIRGGKEHPTQVTFREVNPGDTTAIQGRRYQGTVNYFEGGKVMSGVLAQDDTVLGNVVPKGTELDFGRDGNLVFLTLPRPARIQGVLCQGEGPGSWHTVLYPSGRLKLAWPAEDQEVQGIPCRKATFFTDAFGGRAGLLFHPNGRIQTCKLSRDFTVEGQLFRRGDHLNFDEEGHLVKPY